MDMYLTQTWSDPRLAFDPAVVMRDPYTLYGSDALATIWAPDTTFTTAKDVKFHAAQGLWDNDAFRIWSNGTVQRKSRYRFVKFAKAFQAYFLNETFSRMVLTFPCNLDLWQYPFDIQHCDIYVESCKCTS